MARVRPEVREALVSGGRWRDFCRYRKGLIEDEGVEPVEAMGMAVAKFCPEFAGVGEIAVTSKRKSAKRRVSGKFAPDGVEMPDFTIEEPSGCVSAGVGAADAAARVEEIERKRAEREKAGLVGKDAFAGKAEVSAADEILWVVRNLYVDVGVEDAPGQMAWTILKRCRQSSDLADKFLLNVAADVLKRRSAEDESDKDKWDGVGEYDLLGAVGAFTADGVGDAGSGESVKESEVVQQ